MLVLRKSQIITWENLGIIDEQQWGLQLKRPSLVSFVSYDSSRTV